MDSERESIGSLFFVPSVDMYMSAMITDRTFKSLSNDLDDIDPLFAEMWETQPRPTFTDEVDTAALSFTRAKGHHLLINPRYWKKANRKQKLFIICHEYCHLIFGHWLVEGEWENIAQDIQVNELLIRTYCLTPPKEACTLEMVFKEKSYKVERRREYQYYLDLILRCLPPSERR